MVVATLNQIRLVCWSPKELPSVSKHLLQLAYNPSIRVVDKTYLIEPVSDMSPFWDQRDKKYHNRDLKPKGWDEIREKLKLTGKH